MSCRKDKEVKIGERTRFIREEDYAVMVKFVKNYYGMKTGDYEIADSEEVATGDYIIILIHKGDYFDDTEKGKIKYPDFRVIIRMNVIAQTFEEIARFTNRPDIWIVEKHDTSTAINHFFNNPDASQLWIQNALFVHCSPAYEGTILMAFKIKVGKKDQVFVASQKFINCHNQKWIHNMTFGEMYDEVISNMKIKDIGYKTGHAYELILKHPENQIVNQEYFDPVIYLTQEIISGKPVKSPKNEGWRCGYRFFDEDIVTGAYELNESFHYKHTYLAFEHMPRIKSFAEAVDYVNYYKFENTGTSTGIGGQILLFDYQNNFTVIRLKERQEEMKMVGNANNMETYFVNIVSKDNSEEIMMRLPPATNEEIEKLQQIKNIKLSKKVRELKERMNQLDDYSRTDIAELIRKTKENDLGDPFLLLIAELKYEAKVSELNIRDAINRRPDLLKLIMKN